MKNITFHTIRQRVLNRRSDIVKLPGGLAMLNMIINRIYDVSDMLAVEEQLDDAKLPDFNKIRENSMTVKYFE